MTNHDISFETEEADSAPLYDLQIHPPEELPEDDLDDTVAYADVDALNESSTTSAIEPDQQPGSTRTSSRLKNNPQWMRSGEFILSTKRR